MRIIVKTTPNNEPVGFDYQQKLVGVLHKWIGEGNELHGRISLYSFSWLQDGKKQGDGLTFEHGAKFFISFHDEGVIKDIVRSILKSPEMFCGMEVCDVSLLPDPDLSKRNVFYLASPVFLHYRENDNEPYKHYTFEDERSSGLMTEILKKKMEIAGLPKDETLNVRFDLTYSNRRVKLMNYKGIKNKASMCPVIIEGSPLSKQFAWNVGIGNSTGIGFGAIY